MAPPLDPARRTLGRGTPGPLGDSPSPFRAANGAEVVVRRTRRRKTGVAAFWESGRAVIAVPARMSVEDEDYWIPHMVQRLEGHLTAPAGKRRQPPASDEELMRRCLSLSARYLGSRAVPVSVRWVTNQNGRWGSATCSRKTIRISHQVRGMPEWVLDYVLLHELAHLIHPNHSADFWAELDGYADQEKAKAFLQGASFASSRNLSPVPDEASGEENDEDVPAEDD